MSASTSKPDAFYDLIPEGPPLDYERAARTVYEGFRNDEGSSTGVLVDGVPDVLPWRLDLFNHSPTGLEWGYSGSGPHQLALAILAHATGDAVYARAQHWTYARQVTCRLPRQGFSIRGSDVLKWVEAHPITKEDRYRFLPRELQGELIDRSIVAEYKSDCCGAACTYESERTEQGRRRSFCVCTECGARNEF